MTDQKLRRELRERIIEQLADHIDMRELEDEDLRLIHKAAIQRWENVQEAQGMIAWTRWLG